MTLTTLDPTSALIAIDLQKGIGCGYFRTTLKLLVMGGLAGFGGV